MRTGRMREFSVGDFRTRTFRPWANGIHGTLYAPVGTAPDVAALLIGGSGGNPGPVGCASTNVESLWATSIGAVSAPQAEPAPVTGKRVRAGRAPWSASPELGPQRTIRQCRDSFTSMASLAWASRPSPAHTL